MTPIADMGRGTGRSGVGDMVQDRWENSIVHRTADLSDVQQATYKVKRIFHHDYM